MTEPELAKSSGGDGPSWSRANGSASAVADVKSAGKTRPPGIAKQCATFEPDLTESSVEVGPSLSRTNGSAYAVADVKSTGKTRPPGIAKQCATIEPELAESSVEVGPSWSRANGNSAAATAAVNRQFQHLWDVPQCRERLVKEIKKEGERQALRSELACLVPLTFVSV